MDFRLWNFRNFALVFIVTIAALLAWHFCMSSQEKEL